MLAWDALGGLDAYRITEIPRRPEPGPGPAPAEPDDPGRIQRLAALVAAYHAGALPPGPSGAGTRGDGSSAVAIGWVRHDTDGPVQLLAAGPGLVGSDEGREVFLALPGGARARPLGRGSLTGLMARLPAWRAIGGISDGLLPGDERRPDGRRAPSLEECLLAAWPGPFGWLLVAEPLSAAEIGKLAEELAQREQYATGDSDRFPGRATAARRLSLRHGEMRRGASSGMWRIWLLAGGADTEAATRVAGLVCASADLSGLPYAITPDARPARGLREALEDPDAAEPSAGGDAVAAHPFCASSELVGVLCRPPEREMPGIRLPLRPDFDVTQETVAGRAAITVGEILDRNRRPAGSLTLPLDSLNRHVFVSGATGSGKSQTVRALLEAATAAGIPWLVVEPAKAEYRLMAARLAGTGGPGAGGAAMARVVRIRPGESDAIAAGLNPLEPAADGAGRRFPLQTHADLVKALFIATFRSDEPFPQVLSAALTRVYEEAGWDLALGETVAADANPGYPSLTDLQRAAIRVVREIGYSQRITDDVLGFIKVRLSSLRLGTTGRFLEGGHQLDFGALLDGNAVLEIEDVGDDSDKAFLMGTVLIRLAEHLRMASRSGLRGSAGLRHLTVIEEAHRLLRRQETGAPAGAAAHAVEMFAGLLAEIRAYGEGLIIAEQIPDRLVPDVIKNTAVKITHRLPAADDREAVGEAGEAATATPAAVVRPRSITCGADCASRPCTLRDMRVAQRALDEYPPVRLWTELSVLAHLTGWPMPVPRTALLSLLQMMPSRLRNCGSPGYENGLARRPVLSTAKSTEVCIGLPIVRCVLGRYPQSYPQAAPVDNFRSACRQQFGQPTGGRSRAGSPAPAAGDAEPDERDRGEQADARRQPGAVELAEIIEPVRLGRALHGLGVDGRAREQPD